MKVKFLNLDRQTEEVRPQIDRALKRILDHQAFIAKDGYLDGFETSFATKMGCNVRAVGVSSGTSALELAIRALELPHGSQVILPVNSFFATTEAVLNNNLVPMFVDVEKDTGLINCDLVERTITDKTVAILPVHLYGQPCDLTRLRKICDTHNLKLIQDAAQAHGATHKGKHLVEFGDVVCYSCYPGKNLGGITDGGVILTNDRQLRHKIAALRNHGRQEYVKYDHAYIGTNARMSQINAAALECKLPHLEKWNKQRRSIAHLYDTTLNVPHMIERYPGGSVYHLYVINIPYISKEYNREHFMAWMKEQGISTGIHYPIITPLLDVYTQPDFIQMNHGYIDAVIEMYPVAYGLSQECVSLPICGHMTMEEAKYVVEKVNEYVRRD